MTDECAACRVAGSVSNGYTKNCKLHLQASSYRGLRCTGCFIWNLGDQLFNCLETDSDAVVKKTWGASPLIKGVFELGQGTACNLTRLYCSMAWAVPEMGQRAAALRVSQRAGHPGRERLASPARMAIVPPATGLVRPLGWLQSKAKVAN